MKKIDFFAYVSGAVIGFLIACTIGLFVVPSLTYGP